MSWPLGESLDDAQLERRLLPAPVPSRVPRALPHWSEVHRELRGKGVTLALLWQEYKAAHPEGLQYSRFCEQYRAWASKLDVVMRQELALARRCTSTMPGTLRHLRDDASSRRRRLRSHRPVGSATSRSKPLPSICTPISN